MKRVIVPLDGSALAEQAIPMGAYLSSLFDSQLELVHVIEQPIRDATPEQIILPSPDTIRKDLMAVAERHEISTPVSCNVLTGDPVQRLLKISERDPDAVIVMATHGRGGAVRALLGSVADKVVRGASGPVVLVRPATDASASTVPVSSILVPLDGSEFAERALPPALEIVRLSGASLHLVRVVESLWTLAYPTSPYDGATPDPYVIQQLDEQLTDDATGYLKGVASRLQAEGAEATWSVARGRPVDEIAVAAHALNAGLIVTTTHGRGGVSRMFQGSVATGLMSHSVLPLMIIPAAPVAPKELIRYEPERVLLL
jgi:nucleotide-binding universal stress UspA family protein